MTAATKSLSLPDQFKTAIALVNRANAIKDIASKDEYDKAQEDYRSLIQFEKELDAQYATLECVIQAKAAQVQKKQLAADFDAAKKNLKNGPMKRYDDAREAERQAEERRQQAEAQRLQDIETAKQVEIQRQEFLKAEVARKAAEAEQKKAEAAQRAAQKSGDEAKAKAAAERAEAAKAAAQAETDRQEAARAEAAAIKADAAAAPAPTVVLEKTHAGVTRRKVFKWRLTTKDRRQFVKGDITSAIRLGIADIGPLPQHLFILSPVLLNELVDSMGEAAAIKGTLEIKSEMV